MNVQSNNSIKPLKWHHPVVLIATWFCSGLIGKLPGTMGTLAAMPFAFLIVQFFGHPFALNYELLPFSLLAFLIGWWSANRYMQQQGTGHDPGEIVIDEVSGVWLTLAFLPPTLYGFLYGFIFFRLFDIIKPWPISLADRKIHGGLGVMLDDTLAAVFAIAAYWLFVAMLYYVFSCDFSLECTISLLKS